MKRSDIENYKDYVSQIFQNPEALKGLQFMEGKLGEEPCLMVVAADETRTKIHPIFVVVDDNVVQYLRDKDGNLPQKAAPRKRKVLDDAVDEVIIPKH